MHEGPDDELARFARHHHGLFRADDARRAGLADGQIQRRVLQGRSQRIGKGVYRIAGSPPTREQSILGAVWRSNGVASHRTAAELHGLLRPSTRRPEVTVDSSRGHDLTGVLVHRSIDLARSGLVVMSGIPTTDAARTLRDLGQVISARALEPLVHTALHRRLTEWDLLVAEYTRLARPGRRGSGPLGEVLREIDPSMRPAESDLETLLPQILRDHGVPLPVRQHEVLVDGHLFRLDLAYPAEMLLIEGDGFGVHGTRSAFEHDRSRQNLLVLHGWRPLRFTWRPLRHGPSGVAGQVVRALDVRGSYPLMGVP